MTTRLLKDIGKAAALGPREWRDLVQAAIELALARRNLARLPTRQLLAADRVQGESSSAARHELVRRVACAIPRMGARVPWRSDCLVQALAARRWLARHGIAADLSIGVRNEEEFAAHAWLRVGDEIVTGGQITDYVKLLISEDVIGDQARSEAALARNQR